jgi:hypothetical protein
MTPSLFTDLLLQATGSAGARSGSPQRSSSGSRR